MSSGSISPPETENNETPANTRNAFAGVFLSARPTAAGGETTAAVSAVRDAACVTGAVGVHFSGASAVLPGLFRAGGLRPGITLRLLSLRLFAGGLRTVGFRAACALTAHGGECINAADLRLFRPGAVCVLLRGHARRTVLEPVQDVVDRPVLPLLGGEGFPLALPELAEHPVTCFDSCRQASTSSRRMSIWAKGRKSPLLPSYWSMAREKAHRATDHSSSLLPT